MEDNFFETSVGRLKVRYKKVNGKPQLFWADLDQGKINLDPSKIPYEIEFKKAKEDAREYFRQNRK